ncbi:MAG: DUF1761 family protein [Calditrichae bacterium]|nr:DUF1761 family protein [Calditrichia bacterium]
MIFVLAHFVELAEASTFGHGLTTAFWCWFGFVAAISGMHAFFQGNPLKMYFIDIGYSLVGMLLAGGILAIW